jgi:hypothetical protein
MSIKGITFVTQWETEGQRLQITTRTAVSRNKGAGVRSGGQPSAAPAQNRGSSLPGGQWRGGRARYRSMYTWKTRRRQQAVGLLRQVPVALFVALAVDCAPMDERKPGPPPPRSLVRHARRRHCSGQRRRLLLPCQSPNSAGPAAQSVRRHQDLLSS